MLLKDRSMMSPLTSSVGGFLSSAWSHLSSSSSATCTFIVVGYFPFPSFSSTCWPVPSAQMACMELWVSPQTPSQLLLSGNIFFYCLEIFAQYRLKLDICCKPETIQSAASQGLSLEQGSSSSGFFPVHSPSSSTSIPPSSVFL